VRMDRHWWRNVVTPCNAPFLTHLSADVRFYGNRRWRSRFPYWWIGPIAKINTCCATPVVRQLLRARDILRHKMRKDVCFVLWYVVRVSCGVLFVYSFVLIPLALSYPFNETLPLPMKEKSGFRTRAKFGNDWAKNRFSVISAIQ
jgi:hypothetical protein